MDLDIMAFAHDLRKVGPHARALEDAGFAGICFTEGGRTAYLSCTAAALATESLQISTGIAVAFPRSPMVTAQVAWELAEATGGRFALGLGSQVKGHIERRYSSEFSPPGPRMKEYVQAVKAIFEGFRSGKLSFEGRFFDFSLLPPTWNPGPIDAPDPPVYISAVLPWMSRAAGEVADGIHIHPFHSLEYLRDVQKPAVEKGAARAGRDLAAITFQCPVMAIVGDSDEEQQATREYSRTMVAFYGSTPNYASVFEHHGYEGLTEQLYALQKKGDVKGMTALITDDILAHYTVAGGWDEIGPKLVQRYAGVAPSVRLTSYTAANSMGDPAAVEKWGHVAKQMRAL